MRGVRARGSLDLRPDAGRHVESFTLDAAPRQNGRSALICRPNARALPKAHPGFAATNPFIPGNRRTSDSYVANVGARPSEIKACKSQRAAQFSTVSADLRPPIPMEWRCAS